ncbi:hypothetical protein QFZ58_006626 [Streptomyces sp. B1I3]|nr:hypothetical protein [Streptomyces sp. B1I3]
MPSVNHFWPLIRRVTLPARYDIAAAVTTGHRAAASDFAPSDGACLSQLPYISAGLQGISADDGDPAVRHLRVDAAHRKPQPDLRSRPGSRARQPGRCSSRGRSRRVPALSRRPPGPAGPGPRRRCGAEVGRRRRRTGTSPRWPGPPQPGGRASADLRDGRRGVPGQEAPPGIVRRDRGQQRADPDCQLWQVGFRLGEPPGRHVHPHRRGQLCHAGFQLGQNPHGRHGMILPYGPARSSIPTRPTRTLTGHLRCSEATVDHEAPRTVPRL